MKRLFLILFIINTILYADIVKIEECQYQMGEDDSKKSAREKALLCCKRKALEEAGMLVTTMTGVKISSLNDKVKKEAILQTVSKSNALLSSKIIDEGYKSPTNYYVKARIILKELDLKNQNIVKTTPKNEIITNNSKPIKNPLKEKRELFLKQRTASNRKYLSKECRELKILINDLKIRNYPELQETIRDKEKKYKENCQ